MNKAILTIIFSYFILIFNINFLNAATGDAAIYKITMRKVELCTGSTGVNSCTGAVVVGSGDKVIDIASVDAGVSAASYGDPASLPLGETYTHMRVTIDRKFTVKSDGTISGGSNTCATRSTSDSSYENDIATDKYTHAPVVAASSTPQEMDVYLINKTYTRCNLADCSNRTGSQTRTYAQGSGSSTYQSTHASGSSDEHVLVYELTSPFTVALIAPTIDIAFGTKNSISANDVGALCMIDAQEPIVTITIK